jgi:hypothetical protein
VIEIATGRLKRKSMLMKIREQEIKIHVSSGCSGNNKTPRLARRAPHSKPLTYVDERLPFSKGKEGKSLENG